ncbi:rhomboid family intramembrane serine protease [Leptospira perolatii]|uniref:Rhomboid family intramembrane serine protease n=1 Tax=Leptospira perolatii TaxID=2023191 RepID=A0A2M9ZR34_9LEPT|nr:rhomboid family intramembrane serine protease [Leptospira perolatii]PJZ70990.1 rhomboid family intramembrane serine protease [Leptospira perolatii]PJZ74522.1 rhomboid family intramembrane serine protease [Leptospira perolatii]
MKSFLTEFPLTLSFVIIIIASQFFLTMGSISPEVVEAFFVSRPGEFYPWNWIGMAFLHADLTHLFWNMIFLFFLGRIVEYRVGKGKWLLFFFMGALISGFLDSLVRGVILSDKEPTIGASGAISGLAAVAALLSPFTIRIKKKNYPFPVFGLAWVMVYSDIVNLFAKDRVAHWAHIGGFMSVIFAAYFLNNKERKQLHTGFILNLVFVVLLLILGFFVGAR